MPAVSPYFGVADPTTALFQSALIIGAYALGGWLLFYGIKRIFHHG